MIDLKELVLKASLKGIRLFVAFERGGRIIVRARRGDISCDTRIEYWSFGPEINWQNKKAESILDEIIRKFDESERQLIETGRLGH